MGNKEEITARQYATKIVEVAFYERIPNKETICNVVEALINEYSDQQNKQLLARVYELEKANEWISVEYEPEVDENVICCNVNDNWIVCGYRNIKKQWYNQFKDETDDCEIYPTHWMPLPNPPKTK